MRISLFSSAFIVLSFLLIINTNAQAPCEITCPSNVTVVATSSSGASVNYGAIASSGDCGIVTSLPASGSTFPIGVTTVNVYKNPSQLVYALKENTLLTFNIADPSVVSSPLTITGLQSGESIRSIEFRVSDGKLFAVGMSSTSGGYVGRLYTINIITGASTQVGSETFPLPGGLFFGPGVSIDIDPRDNMIRLVTDEDLNMRINPNTGAYTVDGVLDPNNRSVSGIAYSDNIPFATTTTLYDIGFGTQIPIGANTLYIQDPNKGTLEEIGTTGIGAFSSSFGFDISQTGDALVSATRSIGTFPNLQQIPTLFRINLQNGFATNIGTIGTTVEDITIAPVSFTEPVCSFTVTVSPPPPTVTINKAAGQFDPTTGGPVRFTVVFNENVTGFDASDISFAGSTVPGNLVATVTGTGPTYTVSVTGFTGAGNVVASVVAGAAVSNGGALSLASTSTDNVIAVISIPHNLSITKTSQAPYVAAGGLITYIVTAGRIPSPPAPPINNVAITDVLPPGTRFVAFQPISSNSVAPIVSFPPVNQNGTVSLVFPIFDMGNFYTFRLLVAVDAGMTGTISNTATIGGPLGEVDPTNNSATTEVQIAVPPTITCPTNLNLSASSVTCVAQYTFSTNNFNVTGTPMPVISIDATNGNHFFGITDITSAVGSSPKALQPGVYTVTATATNAAGSASCTYTITVVDDTPPKILECPTDITVNNEPGKCSALVEFGFRVEENCSNILYHSYNGAGGASSGSGPVYGLFAGRTFSVGEHTMNADFTDNYGNSSSCSFKITVVDNEKPVITGSPDDVTVECALAIPIIDITSVTASDNCGVPTITHVGDVITDQICANKYTITRTYKATDGSGNTATTTQLITVDDNTPPQISEVIPSKQYLWPANHKMVDVMLSYTVNDNCVSIPDVSISISSNEPDNGTGDGDTDSDWQIVGPKHIRLRAERSAQGTGRIYTITVTVNDGCNTTVSATTEVFVVHNITSPQSGKPFKAGSTVAFEGEFWDVPGNKHTAKWIIDGNTNVKAAVTEPIGNKNGKVTGSFKFTTPGVYKLQMNITDQNGATHSVSTAGDLEAIVVIYDPNGGHTYGGGYFDSPASALSSDPAAKGKASYGFTMNYFKNSTNPKGETQFEFKVGDFEFNALNFDYLVISNSMAQFKGTGKIIGGQSGVGFTMTVVDGQLDGSGIDKIRMKIYNKNNGTVIYDNQPGASDAALPVQAVGAKSIIVIAGNNYSNITKGNAAENQQSDLLDAEIPGGLVVNAYPNPSANDFSIAIQTNAKERIVMQVVDMYGRMIESKNISVNSVVRFGDRYRPGTYIVRIIQGKAHKEIKLVKLSD